MANAGRNFSLTDHHQQFVDAQVSAGRHASGSEVVREALRRYEDDIQREQAHIDYLRRLGDEGEAAIARGEYVRLETQELADYVCSIGRRRASTAA